MVKLQRVCVPLTMACDFNCRYCYRAAGKRDIPSFNGLMRAYLAQLSPEWCQSVIASGGEPLLVPELVYELFSYTPHNIHKKVLTNGANLTREFVEWANLNKVEVQVSHDGAHTKQLRGYDVLADEDLLPLIRNIECLTIHCVCTAYNPNPYKNYQHIKQYLGRGFYFSSGAVFGDEHYPELIDGFNYAEYSRGRIQLLMEAVPSYPPTNGQKQKKSYGFNVLPDGTVTGMENITHTYGHVDEPIELLLERKRLMGDTRRCDNTTCHVRKYCRCAEQPADTHVCKTISANIDAALFVHEHLAKGKFNDLGTCDYA